MSSFLRFALFASLASASVWDWLTGRGADQLALPAPPLVLPGTDIVVSRNVSQWARELTDRNAGCTRFACTALLNGRINPPACCNEELTPSNYADCINSGVQTNAFNTFYTECISGKTHEIMVQFTGLLKEFFENVSVPAWNRLLAFVDEFRSDFAKVHLDQSALKQLILDGLKRHDGRFDQLIVALGNVHQEAVNSTRVVLSEMASQARHLDDSVQYLLDESAITAEELLETVSANTDAILSEVQSLNDSLSVVASVLRGDIRLLNNSLSMASDVVRDDIQRLNVSVVKQGMQLIRDNLVAWRVVNDSLNRHWQQANEFCATRFDALHADAWSLVNSAVSQSEARDQVLTKSIQAIEQRVSVIETQVKQLEKTSLATAKMLADSLSSDARQDSRIASLEQLVIRSQQQCNEQITAVTKRIDQEIRDRPVQPGLLAFLDKHSAPFWMFVGANWEKLSMLFGGVIVFLVAVVDRKRKSYEQPVCTEMSALYKRRFHHTDSS